MNKTISYIETVYVNGGAPKSNALPTILRAPKHMKCFRATITINTTTSKFHYVWIASNLTNLSTDCIILGKQTVTVPVVPPAITEFSYPYLEKLILDRRGAGYMEDEFYLYGVNVYVNILWEGYKEQ